MSRPFSLSLTGQPGPKSSLSQSIPFRDQAIYPVCPTKTSLFILSSYNNQSINHLSHYNQSINHLSYCHQSMNLLSQYKQSCWPLHHYNQSPSCCCATSGAPADLQVFPGCRTDGRGCISCGSRATLTARCSAAAAQQPKRWTKRSPQGHMNVEVMKAETRRGFKEIHIRSIWCYIIPP